MGSRGEGDVFSERMIGRWCCRMFRSVGSRGEGDVFSERLIGRWCFVRVKGMVPVEYNSYVFKSDMRSMCMMHLNKRVRECNDAY